MIDPFYRTIEGFLTLLQKEWSAFGHKFEDRLGRRGHSKEVSPVCLQFLDCVWQMQRQFATAFEFSAGFVTLLSQCMYSGLFVNFRRNSERERVQMMRNVGPYEDMQTDDFDYSTLAAYVNLLLRTPGTAARILNGSYVPPKPAQKQVWKFCSTVTCALRAVIVECVAHQVVFLSSLLCFCPCRCITSGRASACTTWSCGRTASAA